MSQQNNNTPQHHWNELAQAAQEGDKRAYESLLKEIALYARNIIAPTLSHTNDLDDIIQTVLISVDKSLGTYDPEKPFKSWLFAIIKFRRADYLRAHYAKRQDKISPLETLDFCPENVTNDGSIGEYKDIEAALESLPEKQREIFKLVKIDGYTAKEVSEQKNMSLSAVKVSVHRSIKKLRKVLK